MTFLLPFFALMTAFGAWRAWRRSPLYSGKIALGVVGATVLVAAAVMAFTLGVVSEPMSRYPKVQAILGVVGFLALSTGSMALIVRITDSHVAQLPPAVHLETLHRRRVLHWFWRFLFLMIVAGAAVLAVPADWQWLTLMIGGFPLLLCVPLLAIFYMMARRNDRGMTAVMAGPWVHWHYSGSQWGAWAKDYAAWHRSQVGPAKNIMVTLAKLFALVVP